MSARQAPVSSFWGSSTSLPACALPPGEQECFMAKSVRLSLSPLSIFMPFRSSYKLGGCPSPQFFII